MNSASTLHMVSTLLHHLVSGTHIRSDSRPCSHLQKWSFLGVVNCLRLSIALSCLPVRWFSVYIPSQIFLLVWQCASSTLPASLTVLLPFRPSTVPPCDQLLCVCLSVCHSGASLAVVIIVTAIPADTLVAFAITSAVSLALSELLQNIASPLLVLWCQTL